MRILLVSPFFPPQHAVASLRAHSFASEWAAAGESVTVLTTPKYADQRGLELPCDGFTVHEVPFRVPRPLRALRTVGRHGGEPVPTAPPVKSARLGDWPRRAALALRRRTGVYSGLRMPDLTDHWVRPATQWCRDHAPRCGWDVVVSTAGPYTAHLVATALREEGLARCWAADFRDLWTDHPFCHGLFPFTMLERWLERRCLRRADLITTVSREQVRRLRSAARRVALVRNGWSRAQFAARPADAIFERDGLTRLVYTGTLYPQRQPADVLFEGLARLRERSPEIAQRVRVVAAGLNGDAWRNAAAVHDAVDLLEHRGVVGQADALCLQRDADAIIQFDWQRGPRAAWDTKVYEYLAAEAPILIIGGAGRSPLARLIGRAGRGIVIGRDPQRLAEVLEALVRSPGELAVGPANRRLINCLTREHQARRLLRLLRATGRQGKRSTRVTGMVGRTGVGVHGG